MFKLQLPNLFKKDADSGSDAHSQEALSYETVQQLSMIITSVLYDSLTSTNTWQENQRLDILLFLKTLCRRSEHFRISPQTYITCTLEQIQHSDYFNRNERSIDNAFEYDLIANYSNPSSNVISYFEKLHWIHERKKKRLEMIQTRDRRKCNNEAFNLHKLALNDFEVQDISGLLQLKNRSECERSCVKMLQVDSPLFYSKSRPQKEDLIMFAYSLVNLNSHINTMYILPAILKAIASSSEINCYEHTFVSYVWNNQEKLALPAEVLLFLIESYGFIYEIPIIKMATDALQGDSAIFCVPENVGVILSLARNNETLKCTLKGLMYELYSCSNYSSKLEHLLLLL